MFTIRLPRILFAALAIAGYAECLRDVPLLPNRLASHFNSAGLPNSYLSKSHFLLFYVLLIGVASLLEFGTTALVKVVPPSAINLPNKSYWLSAPRAEATCSYLRKYSAWSGCILLALLVYTMHLVLIANMQPQPRLPIGTVFFLLALFISFSTASVIMLLRRFSRPPNSHDPTG